MKLQRFSFTAITGIFFLIALYGEGLLLHRNSVSPVTVSQNPAHRVATGIALDGSYVVTEIAQPAAVPARLKLGNSARTLRVFVVNNTENGFPSLVIESTQPHAYYQLSGDFVLTGQGETLRWQDDRTVSFRALFPDGTYGKLSISLTELRSTREAEDIFNPEHPQGSLLPSSAPRL